MKTGWSAFGAVLALGCGAAPLPHGPVPVPKDAAPVCPLGGCRAPEARASANAPESACAGDAACAAEVKGACDEKSPQRCINLALGDWSSGRPRLSRVFMLFDRACTLGSAVGCHYAGGMRVEGKGTTADVKGGEALLDRACEAGVARACGVLAQRARHTSPPGGLGPGTSEHYAGMRACLEGNGDWCFTVAVHVDVGDAGYDQDVAKSHALYDLGCREGSLASCNNLGFRYFTGRGVPKDLPRAAELFERACRSGEMTACANLGLALEHGQGVAKDVARAAGLYTLACSFGRAYGCIHAHMLEEYEHGAPRDLTKARELWATRCEKQNDGKACSYVGMLAEDGLGGEPEDEQRAAALMQRACRLAEAESCRWLRDHARAVGTK